MRYIEVEGGYPLQGELTVQGSKNAALPMMAAALLTQQPVTLKNCPAIEDVQVMCELLEHMGVQVSRTKDTIRIQARRIQNTLLPEELVNRMRSSIMLMGPLLSRAGRAEMAFPGGCVIGARPVDLHVKGLSQLGYEIQEAEGRLLGRRVPELSGGVRRIHLAFPSVGATENLLMGSVLGGGKTIITGAAREPEVRELALMLTQMGARIQGIGSERLVIHAVPRLRAVERRVMADRIVTGTYLICTAVTGGNITLNGVDPVDNLELLQVLSKMGCQVYYQETEQWIQLRAPKVLKPVDIRTEPYPGFATDLQAMMTVAMTQADGVSHLEETIFENRFRHVEALRRMGARIEVRHGRAVIHGSTQLRPDWLWATDLRAGAAMVLAGLCAKGKTRIGELSHIERGYEDMVRDLSQLGAQVSIQES